MESSSDERLVGDWFAENARTRPEEPALDYQDVHLTWSQWHERVLRLVSALREFGVERGGRVAFLDKNNPACLELTYAVGEIGAASAVINWRLAADELDYVLNDCGASVVFVGEELLPAVAAVRDRLQRDPKIVVVGGAQDEYEALLAAHEPGERGSDVTADDVFLLMYSSGTTGRPKGVMLTHRNIVAHTESVLVDFDFGPGDKNLVAMPLFHVGGTSYAIIGMAAGMPSVMTREPDPKSLFGALAAGATHAFLVPAVVAATFAAGDAAIAALGQLKRFCYGASPMPLPLLRKALAAWPEIDFLQVYGMTEVGGVISTLDAKAHRDTANEQRLSSAGTLIPGVQMRIVDPATEEDVPEGEPGELWFKSDQVMAGYLNRPEDTRETIVQDGWLRSGDIGYTDSAGFIFISDRVKDMIITGGENVYSPEVEQVVAEHPAVNEVAVIGVPDDRWGESVKAVVTLVEGADLAEDELIEYCREHLAKYKCPRSVDFVDELPRNPTGKILKKTLRQPYWADQQRQV